MLRSIEHLYRIIDRASASGALPDDDIKRARACLDLIYAEHHAEQGRLLIARTEETQRRRAAERRIGRLRQQLTAWKAAAEAAWETIEREIGQATSRRPALRLIERPPLSRPSRRGRAEAGAGEDDPSPFFWPKIRLYGSAQPVARPHGFPRSARLAGRDPIRISHRPAHSKEKGAFLP